MKEVEIGSWAELDSLIAKSFDLPMNAYSTDFKAALELVNWQFNNSDMPHFEVFRSEAAGEEEPFLASFEPDAWDSGKTAPIAICKSALRYIKRVKVKLSVVED